MAWARSAGALIGAGWKDTVRRPSACVGVLALGGALAVIPHLGNPAAGVRDNAALAVELSIATWMSVILLSAGVLGVRAIERESGVGLASEIAVSPASIAAVVVARWASAVGAAATIGVAAVVPASIGWWWGTPHADLPRGAAPWTALLAGAFLGTCLAAAIGMVYRACVPRALALVLLVVHLAGARALAASAPTARWASWIPDPQRLDAAREFAFGQPISGTWIAWSAAVLILQIVAFCALAAVSSSRSGSGASA